MAGSEAGSLGRQIREDESANLQKSNVSATTLPVTDTAELVRRTQQEGQIYFFTTGEVVIYRPSFLPYHLEAVLFRDTDPPFEFATLVSAQEPWVADLDQNWKDFCGKIYERYQRKLLEIMNHNTLFPWWQGFKDEGIRNIAHRVARNSGLSLANEANRRPGGVPSMSIEEAEKFATDLDKFNADLDYVEAATKKATTSAGSSAQPSTQAPVEEDTPHVLEEVKAIKKKKKQRKMKAKVNFAKHVQVAVADETKIVGQAEDASKAQLTKQDGKALEQEQAVQQEEAVPTEKSMKDQIVGNLEKDAQEEITGQEEKAMQEAASAPMHPEDEPALTQQSINRRARADSVHFIRSRTNSRSGANSPLTAPIRDTVPTVAEAVQYLPSSADIADDFLQPEDISDEPIAEEKRFTREEKGKFVIRDPPVDEGGEGEAPVPEPFTLAEPTFEDNQPALQSTVQGEDQAIPKAEQTQSDAAPQKKKKKKKGGKKKKKISHPERVKKYIQAAKTTERLERYKNPQTPLIRLPPRFARLHLDSSSTYQALRGGQFGPQGNQAEGSQAPPAPPPASKFHPSNSPLASAPDTPSNLPPGMPPPPAGQDPARGFQNIRWAYATHTEADAQLRKYNVFLFEKLPIIRGAPLQFPEPYHNLSEQPPIIVSHEDVVADAPAVHFNGDPNVPGDTLMNIFACTNRRPDARAHPGHPDYVNPRLLQDYQAVEIATGQPVWRHDRDFLDCSLPKCKKKIVDPNPDTILCLGCGPKTYTRYCSIPHMIEDLKRHWRECGTDQMLIKRVIDHNTMPPRFWRHCPAIPNIHGFYSLDRYRQRAYAMLTAGQYTLMNYGNTNPPTVLTWPTRDPNHVEMSSRVERVLNVLLFDNKQEILICYFYRMIRELLQQRKAHNFAEAVSLITQIITEFDIDLNTPCGQLTRKKNHHLRREAWLRPLCEADWDGDTTRHHKQGSKCAKYFDNAYHGGEIAHAAAGKGVKGIVEAYEAKYWILRAWRQRHECPYWRQRAENTGDVKFPNVKVPEYYPHPYLGEGFEGWGAPDHDMLEVWGDHTPHHDEEEEEGN